MKKQLPLKFRSVIVGVFSLFSILPISGLAQNGYFGHYFNHISSVANSSGNFTTFSDSWLDGDSTALCLVTAKYNPNDVYSNFNYGVFYYSGTNWALYNEDGGTSIPDGASYNVVIPITNGSSFLHNSTVANISSNVTELDNALTNNNPNALVFFTHNWSVSYLDNNKAMGVYYSGTNWKIYSEDQSAFQLNDNFNVFAVNPSNNAFIHTAAIGNINVNGTTISNPYLDGNPNATIIVSHNWSANTSGVYLDHPIGVFYDGANWIIYNQDVAAMPVDAAFNVLIADNLPSMSGPYGNYFNHISSVTNSSLNTTNLSDSWLDDSSSARCLVTACFNPNDVYSNFNFGVWYTDYNWSVYNEDGFTAIPNGSSYNVLVPRGANGSSFLHNSTVANISSNGTELDDALTNNNPNALVFFTHNWSVSNIYNNKAMGVYYSGTNWKIYSEDQTAFQLNDNFNVFAVNPSNSAFIHTAAIGNINVNGTTISNSYLDGNPSATIIVSHNWSANTSEVYLDHPIGVWYDGTNWIIFNQDLAAMPVDAAFNVLILDSGVTTAVNEVRVSMQELAVFPAFATNLININFSTTAVSNARILVLNVSGQIVKEVYQGTLSNGFQHLTCDVSNLSSGVYFVELLLNESRSVKKIVVSK